MKSTMLDGSDRKIPLTLVSGGPSGVADRQIQASCDSSVEPASMYRQTERRFWVQ